MSIESVRPFVYTPTSLSCPGSTAAWAVIGTATSEPPTSDAVRNPKAPLFNLTILLLETQVAAQHGL
jgi:hypothetical protein